MGLYHCPGPEEGGLKQETLFLHIEVIRNVLELDSVSSEERINNHALFSYLQVAQSQNQTVWSNL